jgi:NitT/TauT family transport system permease protein
MERIKAAYSLFPVFMFLLIWEMAARLELIPGHFFFPPFTAVLQEFYHLTANGVLPANFLRSLTRVLIGFITGSITGLLMGF